RTRPAWIHASNLPAFNQESFDSGIWANHSWHPQITFEGTEQSVAWQGDCLERELAEARIGHGFHPSIAGSFRHSSPMTDDARITSESYALNRWFGSSVCRLRAILCPTRTAEVCLRAISLGYGSLIIAYPGVVL